MLLIVSSCLSGSPSLWGTPHFAQYSIPGIPAVRHQMQQRHLDVIGTYSPGTRMDCGTKHANGPTFPGGTPNLGPSSMETISWSAKSGSPDVHHSSNRLFMHQVMHPLGALWQIWMELHNAPRIVDGFHRDVAGLINHVGPVFPFQMRRIKGPTTLP